MEDVFDIVMLRTGHFASLLLEFGDEKLRGNEVVRRCGDAHGIVDSHIVDGSVIRLEGYADGSFATERDRITSNAIHLDFECMEGFE